MADDERFTLSDLARHFGCQIHRVRYIINSREILPCGLAGSVRLFDSAAREAVGAELERLKARDSASPPPGVTSVPATRARLAGSR